MKTGVQAVMKLKSTRINGRARAPRRTKENNARTKIMPHAVRPLAIKLCRVGDVPSASHSSAILLPMVSYVTASPTRAKSVYHDAHHASSPSKQRRAKLSQ